MFGLQQHIIPPPKERRNISAMSLTFHLYVITIAAFGMDQEIPDYDMDSEDETWLTKQAKKMDVTPRKFENMMDRLEKGSGQMVGCRCENLCTK